MRARQKPSEKALLKAFTENWKHIRHIENERLWFTNIYVLIIAGTFAFLGTSSFIQENFLLRILLFVFLLISSFPGLIITLKTLLEFKNHVTKIHHIMSELNLDDYVGLPQIFKHARFIRVRNAFLILYGVTILMWIFFIIYYTLDWILK